MYYFLLIILLIIGFLKLVKKSAFLYSNKGERTKLLKFSIIIPVHNEEENIPRLFTNLNKLNFPPEHFEVIFVDDESNDQTKNRVLFYGSQVDFKVKYLFSAREKGKSPKKLAITKGVSAATYPHIILIDADVEFNSNWLKSISQDWIKENADFFPGIVFMNYWEHEHYFKRIQALDFTGLISIGLGLAGLNHPALCNAANLAFKKEAFMEVNGYEGNFHILSGDDVFLLEKMIQNGKKICYNLNLESMVYTHPKLKFKDFLLQRARWGSKNFSYTKKWFVLFQIPIYLYYMFYYVIGFALGLPYVLHWFLLKSMVDAFLVYPFLKRYDKDRFLIRSLFATEIFQFLYLPIVGILIMFKKTDWKK